MKNHIKVDVFLMVTYDHLPLEERPRSISGGRATHSFDMVDTFNALNIDEVLEKIKRRFDCTPYIFDDRLEFQLSDTETYSFYLTEYSEQELDNPLLQRHFPNLETV